MANVRSSLRVVISVVVVAWGWGNLPLVWNEARLEAQTGCTNDDFCNDGVFCNGEESCQPENPRADADGCVSGVEPCVPPARCDEGADVCDSRCIDPDKDGDGVDRLECGGSDCDDDDGDRFPGNDEVCDVGGHDEDCNPDTVGFRDLDNDGYTDGNCCNGDNCGDDCDDLRELVHPLAVDFCDGIDNDCDGIVDEDRKQLLCVDADGDGFGSGDASLACPGPNFSTDCSDCDDTNPALHPGAQVCISAEAVALCADGVVVTASCVLPGERIAAYCRPQPNGSGVCMTGPHMQLMRP